MIEYYNIFLPNVKRNVKLEVSVPRNYQKLNIKFDTLYLLDGQNAFKDSHAAFSRSIRATKYLGQIAQTMKKRIIGVAIYNAGSDMGRINEYTPYKITNAAEKAWEKQDVSVYEKFAKDLTETIIPFINKKYPTVDDVNHRFIYGSSLAALTAIHISYKYPNSFNVIGAFSTASFLCPKEFNSFLEENIDPNKRLFIYVGKRETSDGEYNESLYYNSSLDLYNIAKNKKANVRLLVSDSGTHCEACWEKQLPEFLSYIYENDIIYKN